MRSTVIAEVRKTVHVHVGKRIRWCRGIANYLKILLIQFQATFSTLYVMAIFGGKVTYYTMASTLTNQVGIYILKFDTHGFNHTKNRLQNLNALLYQFVIAILFTKIQVKIYVNFIKDIGSAT